MINLSKKKKKIWRDYYLTLAQKLLKSELGISLEEDSRGRLNEVQRLTDSRIVSLIIIFQSFHLSTNC